MSIRFAIVTCSDSRDIAQDAAGAALEDLVAQQGWSTVSHVVVHDDVTEIRDAISDAANVAGADIVITCGGTGLSPRDVTPEATRAACDREVPGIAEAMRAASMLKTRRAMLSRALCMQLRVKGEQIEVAGHEMDRLALVVNFPGSTKAATECWDAIADQFEHAMKMSAGGGH